MMDRHPCVQSKRAITSLLLTVRSYGYRMYSGLASAKQMTHGTRDRWS